MSNVFCTLFHKTTQEIQLQWHTGHCNINTKLTKYFVSNPGKDPRQMARDRIHSTIQKQSCRSWLKGSFQFKTVLYTHILTARFEPVYCIFSIKYMWWLHVGRDLTGWSLSCSLKCTPVVCSGIPLADTVRYRCSRYLYIFLMNSGCFRDQN